MTIIDAIKSGKRFRRSSFCPWLVVNSESWIENTETGKEYQLTAISISADDWEIESPKVTVTREQLAKAWASVREGVIRGEIPYLEEATLDALAKALGLGDLEADTGGGP